MVNNKLLNLYKKLLSRIAPEDGTPPEYVVPGCPMESITEDSDAHIEFVELMYVSSFSVPFDYFNLVTCFLNEFFFNRCCGSNSEARRDDKTRRAWNEIIDSIR